MVHTPGVTLVQMAKIMADLRKHRRQKEDLRFTQESSIKFQVSYNDSLMFCLTPF